MTKTIKKIKTNKKQINKNIKTLKKKYFVNKNTKSKNIIQKKGGGDIKAIISNENEIIDALFTSNTEIPLPIIPNNICENKEGFFNFVSNNEIGEKLLEGTNITNIPRELFYCLGNKNPNNHLEFYQTYKDILPGQDSVSKEIVRYKKNDLLKEYKEKGFIEIKFGNCCKNLNNNNLSKSKFTPYLPDEHHKFIAAIELKLPIKLIKKNNLIQSIGPIARKDWTQFKQENIKTQDWVKKAVIGKCNKTFKNNNNKENCKKTGNLLKKMNNTILSQEIEEGDY
jgi:hypothetical protein